MPFINEYVSQTDIERHALQKLHKKYSEIAGNKMMAMLSIGDTREWLVDRENNIWFMRLGLRMISGENPPIYPGNDIYVLQYKGKNIEVCMERERNGCSTSLNDNPFKIGWKILSLSPNSLKGVTTKELVTSIKEAMCVYGYAGMRRKRPHTNVDVTVSVRYVEDSK